MFGLFRSNSALLAQLNQGLSEHRAEVKEYMEKTIKIMENLVVLQANQTHTDKRVDQSDDRIKVLEARVQTIEINNGATAKDVTANKRIVGLFVTLCITAIFGLASKLK